MKHVIMCFVASLLLSLVSIPMLAQQQSRLISGIVKDESGEPMIGASVLDVSTKQGTIADIDGKFTLEVTSSSKLQISFVGYKDQIISGKDLKKDIKRLEQIDKYAKKMNFAKDDKTKNYYLEGMKGLMTGRETVENYSEILESYQNILNNKKAHIEDLFNEIKIIKKLKVNI